MGGVPPTAFTSAEPLSDDELRAAGPPRYPRPSRLATPLEVTPDGGTHQAIYANFVDAIEHGSPLVADGVEGRMSLELANALILSSHTGQAIELPIDRAAYSQLLERNVAGFTVSM